MTRWLPASLLLLTACGGNVVFVGDGAGGGGTTDGTGASTGFVASAGPTGMGGASQGQTGTGAGDVDDTGFVSATATTGGGECPAEKPTGGACAPEGLICDYGGFCNFVVCNGGMWSFPVC